MSLVEEPRVRLANGSDRRALSDFHCARDDWFEREVEEHIQREALDRFFWRRLHNHHRLLLFENREGLVAVGASEIGGLSSGGTPLANTYVALIAVGLGFRRRRVAVAGQPRVGEFVIDLLIADAVRQRPDDELIYASIAADNAASLRLFRSRGFTAEQPHHDRRYIYLVGTLS